MENTQSVRFVIFESNIPYDPDDYDLWGDTFYDVVEKKIGSQHYGHGTGPEYDGETCNVKTAIENGIVTVEELAKALFEHFNFHKIKKFECELIDFNTEMHFRYGAGLPVVVTKGRKLKGDAFTISYRKTYDLYGREADTLFTVYSPELNVFCETSRQNIQVRREIIENLEVHAYDSAFKYTVSSVQNLLELAHLLAYKMSYAHCDSLNYRYAVERLFSLANAKDYYHFTIGDGAHDPWEKARIAKRASKYKEAFEEQKKSLRNWVETKLSNETPEYREEKYLKCLRRWCDNRGFSISDFE